MDATVDSAINELESFDQIVRNVVDIDYLVKDARNVQSLRTLMDRLQFIFFSKKGVLPFLARLARHGQIEDHDWKDIAFNFELERATVAKAADAMRRHASDLEARFGEDFAKFLTAIVDLKFTVRTVIENMRTDLRKDYFVPATLAATAQMAAALVPSAEVLKESLAFAIEKLDAYEPA
jgi:hypothetical protein